MRRFAPVCDVFVRIAPMIRGWRALCTACALAILIAVPAACSPQEWETRAVPVGAPRSAVSIGALPGYHDGYDGQGWLLVDPAASGMFILLYRQNGPGWAGTTGFYSWDPESPIPPGGSKTWWDFYLWAQNWTLDPPGQVQVRTNFEFDMRPPDGYLGHLVLDYVPASCNWTGPTEFWLDLTQRNTFTLPCATVTDPLQGTRFHLTVYAPIPEPSSLAALLALSLLAAGGVLRGRKR